MQAAAFVAFRDVGKPMGGFEDEFFEQFQDQSLFYRANRLRF